MTDRNCVIGDKPHMADAGYLCDAHLQKLADTLRQVEEEAALLSAVPSMQQQEGRGSSLASHRSPARLNVLVHNDVRHGTGKSEDEDDELAAGNTLSILGTLHSWARLVREERALAWPENVTVSGERDLLSRSLAWVADQGWVDEFYPEVRTLLAQLKRQNGTSPARPIGRCPMPTDDGECGGSIWRNAGRGKPWRTLSDRCIRADVVTSDGDAYCQRCGYTWDAESIDRLKWQLEHDRRPKDEHGRALLTTAEMAATKGLKPGTFAVRAHRAGVKSVDGYWNPADFADTQTAC